MRTLNLMHHPRRSKKAIVGGPLARAIYGEGGLAERLRAIRAHNTAGKGRPAMNDDGTRTYYLFESPARCKFCGRWAVGDDGECRFCSFYKAASAHCDECHCPLGSSAQTTVNGMTVTCHCDCHEGCENNVIYSGRRFVIRDGEEVEAWEVYRNGERFLGKRGKLTGYIWGVDHPMTVGTVHLAGDILEDALLSDRHLYALADYISDHFSDNWSLTRHELLVLIGQFESLEVSYG